MTQSLTQSIKMPSPLFVLTMVALEDWPSLAVSLFCSIRYGTTNHFIASGVDGRVVVWTI